MLLVLACSSPPPAKPMPIGPPPVPDPPEVGATRMDLGDGLQWIPLAAAGDELPSTADPTKTVRFGGTWLAEDLLDGETLLPGADGPVLTSHFERSPAMLFRSRVDLAAGKLLSTEEVDISPLFGGHSFCAASATPWDTHIGSEEYEPDAAVALPDGSLPAEADRGEGVVRVDDEGYNDNPHHVPYHFGWAWEIGTAGAPTPRLAMGRFSRELSVVMPDQRTVYMSDDARGGGLYLFLADEPGKLDAGNLFAAQWSDRMVWIPLGHATDADLTQAFAHPPAFGDLFTRTLTRPCPSGSVNVVSHTGNECLAVKPGKELLASRFETRRFAGVSGASTFLTKTEGIAVDADDHRLFLAQTSLRPPFPGDKEGCGVVWSFDLGSDLTVGSDWVARKPVRFLDAEENGKACPDGDVHNPDNLVYVPKARRLLVAEDTDLRGGSAWLWSVDVETGSKRAILRVPSAEFTGLGYSERYGYVTLVTQSHTPAPSRVGLLGPW